MSWEEFRAERIRAFSALLATGGTANILLALCLVHTWKYWRQVKWYIILMIAGNLLEMAFDLGLTLGVTVQETSPMDDSIHTCRFLAFMASLGKNLSNMAVAALALHVLLTSITGCQGNRLRHSLVLGLFVLLSLPFPLSKLSTQRMFTLSNGEQVCGVDAGEGKQLYYSIGASVSLVFFPLFICLISCVASGLIFHTSSRATIKGDEDGSDLILITILGTIMCVCMTPFFAYYFNIYTEDQHPSQSEVETLQILHYVMYCQCIASAFATVVFAYVHAFRHRGESFNPIGNQIKSNGERQKLVN